MDAKIAAVGYEIWMCRDLETECPFCHQGITEPAGALAEFLVLLAEHEKACPGAKFKNRRNDQWRG